MSDNTQNKPVDAAVEKAAVKTETLAPGAGTPGQVAPKSGSDTPKSGA